MSLTLVTAPTSEPVTLSEAKAHLRVDFDEDDALIRNLIVAATDWVEGQTKRALITQTWDYSIDWGWPYRNAMPYIRLPLNPVASVTSITYVDGNSPNPTLTTAEYEVTLRQHGSFIVPAYGVSWDTPRSVPSAIVVRFVAGESSAPQPLKQAILILIAHWYEKREPTLGGIGVATVEIPLTVESLISPYRAGASG